MGIQITGQFEPSGGAGSFNLYDPADMAAGNVDVALTLIAGGKVDSNGTAGEVIVQTGAGAPSHSASEGTQYWDTSGNALYVNNNGSTGWTAISGGSGETNTASNVGTGGVGVYKQKTGVDLEFKKINAGSAKITITDDTGNSEVDVDLGSVASTDLSDTAGLIRTTSSVNDLSDVSGLSAITGETGTGSVVRASSPTLTTPTISATGFTNANHAHTGATSGGVLLTTAVFCSGNNVLVGNDNGVGTAAQELSATEVRTILNVENGADVTDATNVNAAGAVMESDLTTKGDLLTRSASAATRLGVGINPDGYVLTIDAASTEGIKWAAASGGMSDVVDDTTPQLGGDLDVAGNDIVSGVGTSGNINLIPDGSGRVVAIWSGKEVGRITSIEPPDNTSGNIATGKVFVGAGTPAQLHRGIAFSPTTDEYMAWKGFMLPDYDNASALQVQIPWVAETHAAATVKFAVTIGPIVYGSDDLDTTDLFSGLSATTGTDTSVTQGVPELMTVDITRAQAGSINAGDGFYLGIRRDTTDTLNSTDVLVFPDIRIVYA